MVFSIYVKSYKLIRNFVRKSSRTLNLSAVMFKFVVLSLAMGEDMEYILLAGDVALPCAYKQI